MSKAFLSDSFDASWDVVVQPWFERNRSRFLASAQIGVVIVPSLSFAQALRSRLARARSAFAGIHFWVPADARRFLGGVFPELQPAADRETLRLLMTAAAEETYAAHPDFLSARAVATDPSSLLASFDRLADAGWSHQELGGEDLAAIGECFSRRLSEVGLSTVQSRDYEIARRLRDREFRGQPIGDLLIVGFSGAHWASWPVLEALSHLSQNTEICLRSPRNDGLGLEAAWVGTWESHVGSAEPIVGDLLQDRATYRYAEAIWAAPDYAPKGRKKAMRFVVTDTIGAEARAAVRQAVEFLGASKADRVAILVPGPGALAREIATGLEDAHIPFWNDVGTPRPGFFERAEWKAFLSFAEAPTADHFTAVIATGLRPEGLGPDDNGAVGGILHKASTRLFYDDLGMLGISLLSSDREIDRRVGECLTGMPFLPARATFGELRATFQTLLRRFKLEAVHARIFGETNSGDALDQVTVSRTAFLAWVSTRALTTTRSQGEFGRHPYARLVLTDYRQAEGMTWSHTVLSGLNEGSYPPPYANSAFLGEDTIFALNEKVRLLNERARVCLPGCAVHVSPGKGQIIGPVEERWAVQQTFVGIVEETTRRAAALLSATNEIEGGAEMRAGEFFLRLFAADFDRSPMPGELRRVAKSFGCIEGAAKPTPEVRVAFDRRRDRSTPFDEFSFCYRADVPRRVRLGASRWENVFTYPAEMWCLGALGISLSAADGELPWNLTVGEWAHAWLASAGGPPGTVVNNRGEGHFRRSVETAAENTRSTIQGMLVSRGLTLPRWWLAAFERARHVARQFADSLDAISPNEWPSFACEVDLPKGAGAEIDGGRIELFGRTDLVFFDRCGASVVELLAAGARCWLNDFKSGKNNVLSSKRLGAGEGVQLALYSLALAGGGASDVGLTLLKPGAVAEIQLTLAEVRGHGPLWSQMFRLQETGRFGQLEPLRDEFRRGVRFPLATLAIPTSTLFGKWRLTHPDLG